MWRIPKIVFNRAIFSLLLIPGGLLGGFLVHAQFVANEYEVQVAHVFPGSVTGDGFENVETVTFQNVGEYALFDEFNQINSAYLSDDAATELRRNRFDHKVETGEIDAPDPDQNSGDQPPAVTTSTTPTGTDAAAPAPTGASDSGTTTTATGSPESITRPAAGAGTATDTEQGTTGSSGEASDSLDAATTPTDPTSATPTDPAPPLPEPEPSATSATTTVSQDGRVRFALLVAAATSSVPLESATSPESGTSGTNLSTPPLAGATSSPGEVSDETVGAVSTSTDEDPLTLPESESGTTTQAAAQQPRDDGDEMRTTSDVAADTDGPLGSTSATGSAASTTSPPTNDPALPTGSAGTSSDATNTDQASTNATPTPPSAPSASPATTAASNEGDEVAPAEPTCGVDCGRSVITMSDFSFPLGEGEVISDAQFRMSLAAEKKATREAIPTLTLWYTFAADDTSWQQSGSVLVDGKQSNGVNGGYFLFALPDIDSEAQLRDLRVQLRYGDDPNALADLFVESAWLELVTVSETERGPTPFEETLTDTNYEEGTPAGDTFVTPEGDVVEFTNTDENEGETLIIKSDKREYDGLTKVTTYFNVTNTSNSSDEFKLQAYFPRGNGEVLEVKEWEQNQPREVLVPEYRPFVYHCEAGWEPTDAPLQEGVVTNDQVPALDATSTTPTTPTATSGTEVDTNTPETGVSDQTGASPESATDTTPSFSAPGSGATGSAATNTREDVPGAAATSGTGAATTAVSRLLTNPSALLVAATSAPVAPERATGTSAPEGVTDFPPAPLTAAATSSASGTRADAGAPTRFACAETSVVRECDTVDGDGTACRVEQKKVAEHAVTKYVRGWREAELAEGELPAPGMLRRVGNFFGFGPDEKPVPEQFEARAHTPETYEIKPGETKYFKMTIGFPPFSTGEYWIEAIGDSEYGLLDPFWSSQWRYRKPITIDNLGGATSTEQQVFVELDSSDSGFWSNVQSDGGDIRFIQEQDSGQIWYDAAWTERIPITIQASEIDDDLTDFPVYVDLADLGTDFFTEVQSDGSDIRVTDVTGTELAHDLVSIDTGAETGELHFRASSTIASTTDTTFYIYYGNAAADAYAATSTYGSENVWGSDHIAVYHLEEDASGAGNANLYQDATSNNYDADDEITSSGKTGKLGAGQEIRSRETNPDDYILFPSNTINGENQFTASFWLQSSQAGDQALLNAGASNDYLLFLINSGTRLQLFDGGSSPQEDLDVDVTNNTWRLVTVSRDASNNEWRIFIDGQEDSGGPVSETMGALSLPSDCFLMGMEQDGSCLSSGDIGQHLDGLVDEIRFTNTVPSDASIAATFRNQSTTTDFYATSTPEERQAVTFTELDHWVQHFDHSGQEADIWVQTEFVPANATSTIYLYYGNSTADSTSDEYAPFTYSTSTDIYYVVDGSGVGSLEIVSLIDNNEVWVDGTSLGLLDRGEATSTTSFASSTVISALGPISATHDKDVGDIPVPISFATTTFAIPSNRSDNDQYVYAPFASTTVRGYIAAAGTPDQTIALATSSAGLLEVDPAESSDLSVDGDGVILEATSPILTFHRHSGGDGVAVYPPVIDEIYGIHSRYTLLSATADAPDPTIYCSSGTTTALTGTTRGEVDSVNDCGAADLTDDAEGQGAAVRFTNAATPIAAFQQADSGGNESTAFWPEREFGTRAFIPTSAQYVAIACSPRFGDVELEIQDATGGTIETGTCSASGNLPGQALFPTNYSAGVQIVATNDVPFYAYYENSSGSADDEVNTLMSPQGRKYNGVVAVSAVGPEEESTDALWDQNNFRWYENEDNITPSTAWDLGETGTAAEGDAITGQGAVNPGDELRLRINLLANNGTGTVDTTAFELQYAEGETCSAVGTDDWRTVGDVGSTTAAFAALNNPTVGDGSELTSTLLSDTDVAGSYEEENFSRVLPNEVGNGQAVEFDWSLTPVSGVVTANSQYCFRMIRATQNPLNAYSVYPQVLTTGPPNQPQLFERFDNEYATSTTPTLQFAASDDGADNLTYELQLGTDETFTSTLVDTDSDSNFLAFVNTEDAADKSPFTNGDIIQFTPQSALSAGTTYWWRVRAIDPDGSNTAGPWSDTFSFTVNGSPPVPSQWFQTTDAQFQTNTLDNATTSGSGSVELALPGGSNIAGEYGTIEVSNAATTTVTLTNTFTDPVVVASVRYDRSGTARTSRISGKTSSSFDVFVSNYNRTLTTGSTTVDYLVMEAGDYLIDDGGTGVRVYASSTSVSAASTQSSGMSGDPGGTVISFPTTFGYPVPLASVTTVNDPSWVFASVYDGSDMGNRPSPTTIGLFLNENFESDGHGADEDVDVIVIDRAEGTNNGGVFQATTSAADNVTDNPTAVGFGPAFSSAPLVTAVQNMTTNGGDGGYAQVDTNNPATASDVTVTIDEDGNGADRGHGGAEEVGVVAFADASGTLIRAGSAQITSTAIDFDDADVGNAWGEVDWTSAGDVSVRVQYRSGGGFVDVPDTALPGNSSGFTSGPINILNLDTRTYNELRLVANLSGVDPELSDWTVSWGRRVEIPELGDPFDNEKTATTTPLFDFTSSDPQGDDLTYEISISVDPTFQLSSTTINSSASSSDFTNRDSGGDSEPFNSGDTVEYQLPSSLALSDTTTYWWRVRAKDPAGSDSYSPWSEPDTFTVDTSTIVSTWFQTTQEQFQEGVLDGTLASTSDSVVIGDEIGEYASTTLRDNTWTRIDTENTYNNMVVVAAAEFDFDNGNQDNGRTVRVRNKTSDSFEIKVDDYTNAFAGVTAVDYVVMEAGDWNIADGGTGTRVIAGTAENVTDVEADATYGTAGPLIDFAPDFSGSPPAVFATVATENDATWFGTYIHDGTCVGTSCQVGTGEMYVALARSKAPTVANASEDIDYIAAAEATGTNNGSLFDFFNSDDLVTDAEYAQGFNQTFSTAPIVTLTHQNSEDGGQGGFAQKDTGGTQNASTITLSISEQGDTADGHTDEIVSVLAFENASGTIEREGSFSGGLTGTIASEEVLFSDGFGPKFANALFSSTEPANSTTSIQIQYQTATGSWALIPDSQVANNSTGNAVSPVDLTGIDVQQYPVIRLLGTLTCDAGQCPTLDDWAVEWSEGVNLSGNLRAYDRSTPVENATVTVAVNGNPAGGTGVTDAQGDFSVGNVTAFAGDTVTVYVDGAPEANEAVGTLIYDGLGDMTGVQLFEQHLTLTSNETPTTTLQKLAASDNSTIGDEDVFFDVNGSGDLSVCAVGSCPNANLWIGATSTLIVSTSSPQSVTAHDLINDGTLQLDANTLRLSGSWDNQGAFDPGTSAVILTATGTSETLSDADGTLDFTDLTFGESSGNATWTPSAQLDLSGDLSVAYGTLARDGVAIAAAGDLTTGVGGFWSGTGTTTLDGSGTHTWSDANPVKQNVGRVVIDGAAHTILLGSDVRAHTVTIGANDTLNANGSNELQVAGDFTNTNQFLAQTGTLTIVGSSTNAIVTTGGNNLHTFRASTTAGSVAFSESTVTLLDDFEVATGTVTLPTTRLNVGGSFTVTGGFFAHNNAEVRFTSGGAESIQVSGTPFLNSFYDVLFASAGDWSFVDTNATTTNTWTQSNGNVTFPSGRLTVGRDFTTSGAATFDANGGEVLFLARSTDIIATNGSSLNDVRIREGSPIRGGSYDSSFTYRDMITIDASNIDDDLTDFPVYLNLSDFASEFFTNVRSDGGDIRITSADGVTEVPREVVSIDTSGETGEVYFQAPTLSSTTNTTFYVYYGSSTATDYSDSDTFGAHNVWDDDFEAVYHLEETGSTYLDSTDNGVDGTGEGTGPTAASGKFGTAQSITAGRIDLGTALTSAINLTSEMTLSTWINQNTSSGDQALVAQFSGSGDLLLWGDTGGANPGFCNYMGDYMPSDCQDVDAQNPGNWQHVVGRYDGSNGGVQVNGSLIGAGMTSGLYSLDPSLRWSIGTANGNTNARQFNGLMDEVRISSIDRGETWITAEYRNMSTSSDFYSVTSGAVSGSRTFSDTNVTLLGDLVIESASAVFPSGVLSVGGSFDNNSVFNNNNAVVSFTATSGSHTVAAGSSTFHTLRFNDSGGSVTVTEHATATNAIEMQSVTDFTLNSSITLTTLGTFTNESGGASTTWDGTLQLLGDTDYSVNATSDPGDAYGEVVVSGDGDIRWWNSRASTYTLLASSSIYSQDHDGVDGDLYIFGDYVRESGTEYWRYDIDFDGTALGTSSERQVNVRGASGARVVASSSAIEIVGTSTATTTIDAQSGSFDLITRGATVSAQYLTSDGLGVDGWQLLASSTVSTLTNTALTSNTGETAITVDASTIDSNPASQFFFNDFTSAGTGANVTLTGSPSSFWWFRDGAGNRYGEDYDAGDGNPGNIRWDDSNFTVDISGSVYSDDGSTFMGVSVCDGVTPTVRVVVDGGEYTDSTTCGGATSSFAFSNVSFNGDPTIVVYLNDTSEVGSVITRTPTDDISDLDIYANRVMTRHEDSAPMTIARLATYDEADDVDLRFVAATSTTDTLTVRTGNELIVASSTTFAPGGNITLESASTTNSYDGSLHLDDGATFSGANGQSHSVGGSFFADTGSVFSAASSTFTFTAATSGQGIVKDDPGTIDFEQLSFTGVDGGWNITADLSVAGNMTVATGTVSGTGDITLTDGQLTGEGTLSMGGSSVVTLESTNTLGGSRGWTFNDLTLGDGATTSTTTRADTATTTILGTLTIAPAHFLDAGSSQWDLAGSGSVFVENGTFLEDTSTVTYSGGGGASVLSTTYHTLRLAGQSGTPTYTFGSTGVLIENDLIVAGSVPTVADLDGNDPVVAVRGDVLIGTNGDLTGSASTELTVSGDWQNSGTFTSNGGEVVFDSSDAFAIDAGASSFGDLTISGVGAATVTSNATGTGLVRFASTSDVTVAGGNVLAVGGQYVYEGGATDWSGSTLSLYGGGDYLVNDKTLSDRYDTLAIGGNTAVRLWNSAATTTVVDATGSLYSQDHDNVDGDLYIWGEFRETSRDDHWSYTTDFDGVALATTSYRQAEVYLANGADVAYGGGSLTVLGTSTASTTIQNQGSGTYGLTISGDADTEWEHAVIRDIDTNGLTFSGSPNVIDLGSVNFLVEQNSGSAMTVGGTAISASPARNFTDVIFNFDTGVTGATNVTATGTTFSGWRFTAHTGNLDGEADDVDPGPNSGNPGYVIWDDSDSIISISGNVYESDRVTESSVCDNSTTNIVLAVEGSLVQQASSSCASSDGFYEISGVSFNSEDTLTLYIDSGAQGATVSVDPISSVVDMDIYEDHVVVRHEGTDPLTLDDLADFDSDDDGNVPFTANGAPTTLSVPSAVTLLIWENKEFAPGGDITLDSGGSGGSLEAATSSAFTAVSGESHIIGGSLRFGDSATLSAADASIDLTSTAAGEVIDVNEGSFGNLTISGTGDYTVTDSTLTLGSDLTVSAGALSLPSATTTIGGSLSNSATLNATSGILVFDGAGSESLTFGGAAAGDLLFANTGSWSITDTNATATRDVTVATGTVTLPGGVFAVGGDVIVTDTITENGGTLALTASGTPVTLTLNGNDLGSLSLVGSSTVTMTDASAALQGDLTVAAGTLTMATNTVSIAGSLDATGGRLHTASNTILMNSDDVGETIDPGTNIFYNLEIGGAGGGWTLQSATTTNNFALLSGASFTLASGERLSVGNVFTNTLGGGATTWSGSTLDLGSGKQYAINSKGDTGDTYDGTVIFGPNTDIESWNSSFSLPQVAPSASLYSQDDGDLPGELAIYGDFRISTSTEFWSYDRDFDGTTLTGGDRRPVTVSIAAGATTTVSDTGTLEMLGASGNETTVQNQGSGQYELAVLGGTIEFEHFALRDLRDTGLRLWGAPSITSLNNGDIEVSQSGNTAITLASTTLNANPSKTIQSFRFATSGTAVSGVNVNLDATTTNAWRFRNHTGGISGELYDQDGTDNCGSIRWDDSDCQLSEQTSYRWRLDDGELGVPDSEWFDDSFTRRQRVRVVNADAAAYSDLAVNLTVAHDGDMQGDFSDLRFTSDDGATPVDFWVERAQNNVEAEIWVEVPSVPAEDTATLFMYYGSTTAASVSSSTATFSAVDDFEDNDISEYSGNIGDFQTGSTRSYGGTYSLEPDTPTGLSDGGMARFDQTVSQGETIRYRQYVDTTSGTSDEICTLFGVQSPVSNNENYGVCIELFQTDRISIVKDAVRNDSWPSVSVLASTTVDYIGTGSGWYEVEVDWDTDDSISVELFDPSGSSLATVSATDSSSPYTSGGYGFTYWSNYGQWDSFTARPLTASDPTVIFGAEQQAGGASWAGAQNTPTSAFQPGETGRLRIAIENTGLDITDQQFQLEYAPKGTAPSCGTISGASYSVVPVASGCTADICMATSSVAGVSNGASTIDLLDIPENTFTTGAFVADPSNASGDIDVNQNFYTEVEYAIRLSATASDEAYCFRVTDNGTPYDGYSNIPELLISFDPVLSSVSLNSGNTIIPALGTTTPITASGTVTDLNGVADLDFASSTIYRQGVGALCAPDDNNCYQLSDTPECTFTTVDTTTAIVECTADIAYHADPTDSGTFSGEEWFGFLEVVDSAGGYDFATTSGVELQAIQGIDVQGAIDFGTLNVDSDTGANNASTSVINLGNTEIDIEIEGTDLTDGASSAIPANNQRFATSTFTYSTCGSSCAVVSSTSPVPINVDLAKPTSLAPPVSDDIYWGIRVPFGINSAPHQGTNTFYPVAP